MMRLPAYDQHTNYDYSEGRKRRRMAQEGHIGFSESTTYQFPPGFVPRFAEDFQVLEENSPGSVKRKLNVKCDGGALTEVNLLTKEKTAEFALKHIQKWGPSEALLLLSSSETGCLYWNILYHFGSYDKFNTSIQPRA